ncbi:hypothetical protein VNI00_018556 [Paramarasmius palmivorus]|uniref:Uncharacterized protein n=1 Tax=Paramarasmius palmivorus TaxID=297713 RepID=A0AAW0AXE8_9AGAR
MNLPWNARPFLDLEASVDRGESVSEDEDEGFINDDEEVVFGDGVDYNTINKDLQECEEHGDAPDYTSLFFKDSQDLLSMETDDAGQELDNTSCGDRDDMSVWQDDETVWELWLVRCKKGRERYLLQYLKRYIDKFNARDLFDTLRFYDDDCGFVYIRISDARRAANVVRWCPVTIRSRGGFNGLDMKAITDPVEVGMALCLRTFADVFLDPAAVWGRGPKQGTWVRLGKEKGKRAKMMAAECSEKDFADDLSGSDAEPFENSTPRLYTNDPAIVLSIDAKTATVAFIPRLHPSIIHKHWPKGNTSQEWIQTLVMDPLQFREPIGIVPVWNADAEHRFEHGLMVKTLTLDLIRPLSYHPTAMEGRLLLQCRHPAVIANFPRIADWRFDIGDVVSSVSGVEGIVVEQSERGPVVSQTTETERSHTLENYSLGWALKKIWAVGDYVRHMSGISGVVVQISDETIVVQDIIGALDYDFSGHVNSFRVTQRDENAIGYQFSRPGNRNLPHWVEAAQLGPHELQGNRDFYHFREEWNGQLQLRRIKQEVFVLSNLEATTLLRKMRTDRIPWKGREVLVTGNCPVKGEYAAILDVHINQPTKSGLMVTVESIIQGRAGRCSRLDYDFIVDRHWELPLHVIERPLLPVFRPPPTYIHPLTFRVKSFKLPPPPPPPPRHPTPPLRRPREHTFSNNDPAFDANYHSFEGSDEFTDPFDIQIPAPSWQSIMRHESQRWLYEAENVAGLTLKAVINGEVAGRLFKNKKMDVYLATSEQDKRAVMKFYKREREIVPHVECKPVHPLPNTMEPIFVFSGPHANKIAIRASTVPVNGQLYLCGFIILSLQGSSIDFTQPIQFLPSDACVLSVKKHVTDQLQYYVGIWKKTQNTTLRGRSRK